jgi:hypothetical protein
MRENAARTGPRTTRKSRKLLDDALTVKRSDELIADEPLGVVATISTVPVASAGEMTVI